MLELRNTTFSIGSTTIVHNVSLALESGRVVAVVGPNGAGKSTVLRLLAGELRANAGDVLLDGKSLRDLSLRDLAQRRAVLPQISSLTFAFRAREVVLMGRMPHARGPETSHDVEIVNKALQAVEADHLSERIYTTLSGGEQQRIHLARVLSQIWEPVDGQERYLLMDEPTSALDLAHKNSVLRLARKWAGQGTGVLLILHDLNLASHYADLIVAMDKGEMRAQGSPEEVLTPEIIGEVFHAPVLVLPHPETGRPLVVSKQ